MASHYKVINETDYSDSFGERDAFALDVLVGLSETQKAIPSKYLYDARGSELFRDITRLPEYYPTNCELEILENRGSALADFVAGKAFNLVELGAGFGRKTQILIRRFAESGLDFRYVPIDISESAMAGLIDQLNGDHPSVQCEGLVSDYFTGLKWLNNLDDRLNFVLFLGSSIGNFSHSESRVFLRNMWNCLNHGDLVLIGFDLKKDIELLLHAYNDKQGVTAAFNLNLLDRINSELGGHFDKAKFRHFGTYDVNTGGMESYIVSLERQTVYIDMIGRSFTFRPWEPIHTEYSYKYLIAEIEDLAAETGFSVATHYFDSRRYFADSIWRVDKPRPSR